MKLLRCILFLALIAAATAFFRIGARLKLSNQGRCGRYCGLTEKKYVRPSRSTDKCFGVFGFLAKGVNKKLSVAVDIFNSFSNIRVAANLDDAVGTCLNLSKGVSVMINSWVDGLGVIYENSIIGISRLLFCVLGNPWENGNFIDRWFLKKRTKAPAICSKDFGSRWGWKRYLRGYSSRDEIIEFYGIANIRVRVEALLRAKGIKISALVGTKKVIIDTLFRLDKFMKREFSKWHQKDFVEVSKCMMTMSGAVASAYKADAGVAVIDEYAEYLEPTFKQVYSVQITTEVTVEKEIIQECDTVELGGALVADVSIQQEESQVNDQEVEEDEEEE